MDPASVPYLDFQPVQELFTPQLSLYGLETDTKVAHTIVYKSGMNWKLLMENFAECFHCVGNHPDIIRPIMIQHSS